jgi:hypothetical protein
LQQAIQLAKIKIELAESQYSSLESLSKQLENAQRDAADNIAAVRASIDGATLPSAAAITEEVEKSVDAAYARADAARAAVVQAPADAVVQAPADVVVQAASEAVQAASEAVPVDAVDAAADAVQNLGGDAVAQAAQVAADAAPDATPIILVAAFLQFAYMQYMELMSIPRVAGDSADLIPRAASLATYADSMRRGNVGTGRSAQQIFFHGLVNLEKEGFDNKGWLFGGPSALYSNAPASVAEPPKSTGATGVLGNAVPVTPEKKELSVVAEELLDELARGRDIAPQAARATDAAGDATVKGVVVPTKASGKGKYGKNKGKKKKKAGKGN